MKHIQRDRKHIIWACFAVATCLLAIAGAFGVGVAVGRSCGPSECAQPDTKERTAPEGTYPEFIGARYSVKREFSGLLICAHRVRRMQRSARKTYHELKSDPTIAPEVVALYADTLTWESPQKIVEELSWELLRAQEKLIKLEVAYRNLFNTDYFGGIR